jgi:2-C-methyl-D-erythritol 4-phosphate cytidylyltransferase
VTALVLAAGSGRRLGGRFPKQFLRVRGRSLVEWCLAAFQEAREVDEVWLVLPRRRLGAGARLRRRFSKLRGVVAGGSRRGVSVERGLRQIDHDGVVLVHDAARPFVTPRLISRVVRAARRHGAAVPALPVDDTLKSAGPGRRVRNTVPRDGLWAVQTPQGFRVPLLRRAYRRGGTGTSDDAALVERLARPVVLVPGSPDNFKITRPEDLRMARDLGRHFDA